MKYALYLFVMIIFALNSLYSHTYLPENMKVSFNGKFSYSSHTPKAKTVSENGRFSCDYRTGAVTDEVRILRDFTFYDSNKPVYKLDEAPGSSLYITNLGYSIFMDTDEHFKGKLTLNMLSPTRDFLHTRSFMSASLFELSDCGEFIGVLDKAGLNIIDIVNNQSYILPHCSRFHIANHKEYVALTRQDKLEVYKGSSLVYSIPCNSKSIRNVQIDTEIGIIATISKHMLSAYDLKTGDIIFKNRIAKNLAFRDVKILNDCIAAGIHERTHKESIGILQIYSFKGESILRSIESIKEIPQPITSDTRDRNSIPWPFSPTDQVHKVWNHYEQHMGGEEGYDSYLHQGLDIEVPINEPTYAVESGIVKCVLTLGGDEYWRMAIAPEQHSGYSNGWLYAHLVEESIQFEVGDSVSIYDYIGDIIYWSDDWGHIHFAEIRDNGLVWDYWDNEWGITHNPLLSLDPNTDTIFPQIENVFPESKFAFCENESDTYLDPDSLYGLIDIIVKTSDYIDGSDWEQPAYLSYYQIKNIDEDYIIVPRTLGQVLNHPYEGYSVDHMMPFRKNIYKLDEILTGPSWMSPERDYYHVLTNNNGDSTLVEDEYQLALDTEQYPDGNYRITVEIFDECGNSDIDSMDVIFKNNSSSIENKNSIMVKSDESLSVYPNPFNPTTTISFFIDQYSMVNTSIYNIKGELVRCLMNETASPGLVNLQWNGKNDIGKPVSSGIYMIKVLQGTKAKIEKILLLK